MDNIVKILLADDDREDRFIMADAFNEVGLAKAIHFVENGEKVLSYLDDIIDDQLPSLIILDLNMPRMNGTQTLKSLKDNLRYCDIPVIIFSTSVNTIEMQECMEIGATSYITKPVTFKECLDAARKFYDFSIHNIPTIQ
jgi:CheY-like chemotaxis protein